MELIQVDEVSFWKWISAFCTSDRAGSYSPTIKHVRPYLLAETEENA